MTRDQLKPGLVVYDVHSHRMGNTTMRSLGVWTVRIIENDPAQAYIVASWNGNPQKKFWPREYLKWRLAKPNLVRSPLGRQRFLTREEKARIKKGTLALVNGALVEQPCLQKG